MRQKWIISAALTVMACSPNSIGEQALMEEDGISFQPVSAKPLPDLSVPRGGHKTLVLDGEITVFGGHTDGFRPLRTAEYFADGAWHTVEMMYLHDESAATLLPDGKVMLLGGCPEPFGIGQSWSVEVYDRATHSFSSSCILDRKRTRASALALPDGKVIVSGNWYADDAIGMYQPPTGFAHVKETSQQRAIPFLIPSADSDVLVFGSEGTRGEVLDGQVDRLKGASFHVPLLDQWRILVSDMNCSVQGRQIASYTYLFVAQNRADSTYALLKLDNDTFSLLETDHPLPPNGIDASPIIYSGSLQVSRPERTAWIQGFDAAGRLYLVEIDYDAALEGNAAALKFYYLNPTEDKPIPFTFARLTSNGEFILAGGMGYTLSEEGLSSTNFKVCSSVYRLSTHGPEKKALSWWWAALFILLAGIPLLLRLLRRPPVETEEAEKTPEKPSTDLMSRIDALMQEQQLFRNSRLKLSDVAAALGTNITYISACINGQAGMSFNDYVMTYRIRYAQRLMRENPGIKLQQVGEDAGFTNERTFYRSFKKITGLTPGQWKESL